MTTRRAGTRSRCALRDLVPPLCVSRRRVRFSPHPHDSGGEGEGGGRRHELNATFQCQARVPFLLLCRETKIVNSGVTDANAKQFSVGVVQNDVSRSSPTYYSVVVRT